MPYVQIQITREGPRPDQKPATAAQKATLIRGISDLLFEVLGKPQSTTFVVIDEVPLENWGLGGMPVADYIRLQARSDSTSADDRKQP